jgi:RNA polymerase sigma-70 factor, ECF subfamily
VAGAHSNLRQRDLTAALAEAPSTNKPGPRELGMARDVDDRAFFRAEIDRLMDRLYGTALRLTRHRVEAEDLVSDAVMRAWSALDQLKDRQSFPKWMLRILTNVFLDSRRGKTPERYLVSESADEEQPFSLFDRLHQPFLLWWGNPEQELVNKLLRSDIERAFDGLPVEFRTVIVLVEVEGCSYAETAEMLGLPIGTVRSRLSRARSLLQRALYEQAVEAGLLPAPRTGRSRE